MRWVLAQTAFIFLLFAGSAAVAAQFPALTGRVVDNAQIISPEVRKTLTQKLDEYERGTSNQVVVFTTPSLAGEPLEEYSNQLFRHWQIGQKGKDNGVLLVIAVQERALRIEVGYGLEGVLTDALAQQIIHTIIVPNFKAGKMEQGVVDGTDGILAVLDGKGLPSKSQGAIYFLLPFGLLFVFSIMWLPLLIYRKLIARFRSGRPSSSLEVLEDIAETAMDIALIAKSSGRSDDNHRGGGSSGGSGFGGGGGSSGGGGASGRW